MIVNFDKLNRFENVDITLCNPDTILDSVTNKFTNSIGILNNYKNLSIEYNFNSQSTGSFEYVKNISNNEEENKYFNQLYNSIVKDRYLFIENFGFAIITNSKSNDKDEFKTKTISFVSCDKELEFCEAPFLTTEETFTNTIANFIDLWSNCCPMWNCTYISNDLKKNINGDEIYRTITEISSENAYNFLLNEIQNAFDCIVDFDYINRTISIYSQAEYVKLFQTTIHIPKNLLNSLGIEGNYDNSYTALEVTGDNEIEIRMVNPTGNNVVYNFNSKLDWMEPKLREKVKKWSQTIEYYKDYYYELSPVWYKAQEDINNLYNDYLVACENLDIHMQTKRNIKASNDTDEIKSTALANINKEIKIDLKGGYREVEISRVIVDKLPQNADEWDENKLYYYILDINSDTDELQWTYINSWEDWVNLSKVSPLYNIDNLDFNAKTYYFLENNTYREVNKEAWDKKSPLYLYYIGLYDFGDKIGDNYDQTNCWKVHSGYDESIIINALEDNKYYVNSSLYSYKFIKEKIDKINTECGLDTKSDIFNNKDLLQLSNYIKTGKYVDNSITITDSMTYMEKAEAAKSLMDKSIRKLDTVIENSEKISIDIKGFIFDIIFAPYTKQLKSGCIINIEVSDDVFEKIYLTSFSIDYEEKTISFTLGNKYNKYDIKSLFNEVLGDISKSTHQITNLKKRIYTLEKIIKNS